MSKVSSSTSSFDYSKYMSQMQGGVSAYAKGGSAELGNYLNGQAMANVDGAVSSVTDNLTANMNPVAKAAVKSAINILMAWVKGQDKQEATAATNTAKSNQAAMNSEADGAKNEADGTLNNAQSEMDSQSETITDEKDGIDERNEENEEQADTIEENQETVNQNNEQIEEIQQQQQELLAKIKERQQALGNQQINLGDSGGETPAPTPPAGGNVPEGGGTPASDSGAGAAQSGDNKKVTVPSTINADGVTDPELQSLLSQYNALGTSITELQDESTTMIEENTEETETIQENNDANAESYENIDAAGDAIVSLYNSAGDAIQNFENILSGKQKMFSQEQIIAAAEQMAMSAINGTEGGVLAAAATAAGASSIVSFGATAEMAAKYAAASEDKFSSVAPRVASNAAIKLAEQTAKQYVNQALSNISQIAGVDLTSIYNQAMDIYNTAAASNPNPTSGDGSSSGGGGSGGTTTTPINTGGGSQDTTVKKKDGTATA